ncbi:MAG: hypothetical protein GF313_14070 [Caldithrix sp.]|nr:hypothetical protein [Caldithrix sp.]
MNKKPLIIGGAVVVVIAAVIAWFIFGKNLDGRIVIPYIAHQKPAVDPHIPNSVPIADKLDEAIFDGLFNVAANPSGITYEDGLGEFMGIDVNNVVTIRLKPREKWHSSFQTVMEDDEISITEKEAVYFSARDLRFTMRRIQRLGSLSPDYVLISQAIKNFEFSGPDDNGEIRFQFDEQRDWKIDEIKEVLSFKILPFTSELNAPQYLTGTGPYISVTQKEDVYYHYQNPDANAHIPMLQLQPFIDNSTYTTELNNGNINTLLSTPFGSLSPILEDKEDFFFKSNISTVFFAVLYNVQRLNADQRRSLRALLDNRKILNRFFKVNTEQQRHIADYKGNRDNYSDYLNYSIFPSSSYYVDEEIVLPLKDAGANNISTLPDTVEIKTCLNYGFREELAALVEILNDPGLFNGKIKATAVNNEEIKRGDYDAVLVPITGYRSNFLFDLYDIFLRQPDFSKHKINLVTDADGRGNRRINPESLQADKNFFRIDLLSQSPERAQFQKLLDYIYGFMSSDEVGDKQAYAQFIDELDQELAMGSWLFSLPSLAYFSTQFDSNSIDLYGVASQLSTIEKWQEKQD